MKFYVALVGLLLGGACAPLQTDDSNSELRYEAEYRQDENDILVRATYASNVDGPGVELPSGQSLWVDGERMMLVKLEDESVVYERIFENPSSGDRRGLHELIHRTEEADFLNHFRMPDPPSLGRATLPDRISRSRGMSLNWQLGRARKRAKVRVTVIQEPVFGREGEVRFSRTSSRGGRSMRMENLGIDLRPDRLS
jgi:hypothetical protein